MAGGKETPRQKMIGMMYLVFIAMLALNMSKEVLSAFGFTNEGIESNNNTLIKGNEYLYKFLEDNASDASSTREKYLPLQEEALKIKRISSKLNNFIQSHKDSMLSSIADVKNYVDMDKSEYTETFFQGGNYSKKGTKFVNMINSYEQDVMAVLNRKDTTSSRKILSEKLKALAIVVDAKFSTDSIADREGVKKTFLDYNYKGYPMVATLTNFTLIQNKVRSIENEFLNTIIGRTLAGAVAISGKNFEGIVSLDRGSFFQGEMVTGKVFLGKVDKKLQPTKVTLNGQDITKSARNGQVDLNIPAGGGLGTQKIAGEITFTNSDGETEIIPFTSEYEVAKRPTQAYVSADKMNIVYRGIPNPISISLPETTGNPLIRPTGSIVFEKLSAGKYLLTPGKSKTVNINISATLKDGSPLSDQKSFRVKDIPPAEIQIGDKYGYGILMSKNKLKTQAIKVSIPNFDFKLNIETISFVIKIGSTVVQVNGNTLNAEAKSVIESAGSGSVMEIFNIEAKVVGSTYQLKKIYGGSVELL